MDVVLLFPGQGSQKPGMGKDLVDAFPAAKDVFARADAALGTSLSQLCFEGPADELTMTHNAQPALLTHGAALWATTRDAVGASVVAAAGHSLGEFSAYHSAGSLSLEDGVRLVRRRGELMYESGTKRPGAMAAILGETDRPIEAICAEATRDAGLVVPANYNCPGQLVISGEEAGVERAMALCKDAGAKRAIRLKVSGAFHSPLMAPAVDGLHDALSGVDFADPAFPVIANASGEPVRTGTDAKRLLIDQLTAPLRWVACMRQAAALAPGATFVELGPGTVLSGLAKRILPGATTVTLGTAAEVEQFLA
jgi:[acyl-carrier-protein] S-malonyltransferase